MEGEKQGAGGDEKILSKLNGTVRPNYRHRWTPFAHRIPGGLADEVENKSSDINRRRCATSRSGGEEYWEKNSSSKSGTSSQKAENFNTILNRLIENANARARARARARADDEADRGGAVEQVPSISISEEHIANNDNCPVCLDAFEFGEFAREMPCSHIFHEKCIFKWLSESGTCPVCRDRIIPPSSSSRYNNSRYPSRFSRFSASPSR